MRSPSRRRLLQTLGVAATAALAGCPSRASETTEPRINTKLAVESNTNTPITVTVDVGDLPFDLEVFYELLGFPTYLAEHAASDLREPDLWTLHSGATYALTHQFRGGDGSALQEYTRLANDLLFNPEATIDRVEAAYERETEVDSEDQQSLNGSTARVQLEEVCDDLAAKAEQFEQREERLRERFAAAENR